MQVVERGNLFGEPAAVDAPALEIELEIQSVDMGPQPQQEDPQDDLEKFCLFGGETISVAEMNAPEEQQEFVGRPLSFYFYSSTPTLQHQCQLAAVEGGHAAQWVHRESVAPDVNAGYKPRQKRCRPGSATRRNKVDRNKRLKQEKKDMLQRQRQSKKRFRR